MKTMIGLALTLVFVVALRAWAGPARHWVCPPCGGGPCDSKVFDQPGTCPVCGMALVDQSTASTRQPAAGRRVAILLFDGAEIIDFSGPYEVFGTAGFDVYTVAATKAPITTAMGMKVVPQYSFDDAPSPSILLVPGGAVDGARHDKKTLAYITQTTAHTDVTMSVCNGAFILGTAGLLDGLSATTTYHLIAKLRAELPKTKVVSDRRFVDNGHILTTAGLSAGIDGALHVVEKVSGRGAAQAAALRAEYDWRPDGDFVRARLADRLFPDVNLDALGAWKLDRTEGSVDHWAIAAHLTTKESAATVAARIGKLFVDQGKWTASAPGHYRFTDEAGHPWTATLSVEDARPGELLVKTTVARG